MAIDITLILVTLLTVTGSIIVAVVNRPNKKSGKVKEESPELRMGQRVPEGEMSDLVAGRIDDLKERIQDLEGEVEQYRLERNLAWDQLRASGIEPIYPRHKGYRR